MKHKERLIKIFPVRFFSIIVAMFNSVVETEKIILLFCRLFLNDEEATFFKSSMKLYVASWKYIPLRILSSRDYAWLSMRFSNIVGRVTSREQWSKTRIDTFEIYYAPFRYRGAPYRFRRCESRFSTKSQVHRKTEVELNAYVWCKDIVNDVCRKLEKIMQIKYCS